MPAIRRWTNKFMSWQISKLCRRKVLDSQCGFRLARYELLPYLNESHDGFAFETENLLLAARHGFQIEFVPIRTIYGDERSKVNRCEIRFVTSGFWRNTVPMAAAIGVWYSSQNPKRRSHKKMGLLAMRYGAASSNNSRNSGICKTACF